MENVVVLSLRALRREAPTGSWLRSLAVHAEEGVRAWLRDGRPPAVAGSVSDHPLLVKNRLEELLERLAGHEQKTAEHTTARRLLEGCIRDIGANAGLVAVLFPDLEKTTTMLYPWHPPWECYPEAWFVSERKTLSLHLSLLDAVAGMMLCRESLLDFEKTRVATRAFENTLVRVARHHGVAGFTPLEAMLPRYEAICLLLRASRGRDASAGAPSAVPPGGGDASVPGTATR
jgi:hypothetical protein